MQHAIAALAFLALAIAGLAFILYTLHTNRKRIGSALMRGEPYSSVLRAGLYFPPLPDIPAHRREY